MGFNVTQETAITTEDAVNIVIPRLRELFHLPDDAAILEDMEITRMGGGGALVKITLGAMMPGDVFAELEEALAARGAKL